jgi:hypothetical protein
LLSLALGLFDIGSDAQICQSSILFHDATPDRFYLQRCNERENDLEK